MSASVPGVLAVVVVVAAAVAMVDLRRQEAHTLVVYTTAALREVLEKDIVPRFQNESGERVELVYVAAGEQYNRLRLSGSHPEADLFLHASPLFLEKGWEEGYFEPVPGEAGEFTSAATGGGQIHWRAWAWSPLVTVYAPRLGEAPDLARSEVTFGFPDPLLSNNGVYAVLWFESTDPEGGRRVLARTTTQPVNAAANINGITDGSFDATLGYEAVALLYQGKGAHIAFDLPVHEGERRVLPVMMSAGVVKGHPHEAAGDFFDFLFANETQSNLTRYHLRSPTLPDAAPAGGLDLEGVERIEVDWSTWRDLESKLSDYVVGR